ncbi:MAG: sigma-70 family RNA polymerase sigma factor [Nocardioides sp.]
MSTTLPLVDGPGDAELISAVRGGDVDAYGVLYERHVEAARRLARQIVSGPDVDDLVSEAFAKVLVVLQRGGGPDLAFRAYLLTAVRRLHVDRIRAASRLHTTDDLTPFDPGVPFRDTAVEGFENATAAKAFASLPERWQTVLWHTEVERQKPAEVALLLGMSANSVSALAYRAREGLREAFLSLHVQESEDAACTWTHQHLGAYIRGGVSRRDAAKVEAHLEECRRCMAIYLELTEVNSGLAALLGPLVLGGAAAAYAASAGGLAAKGGLVLLAGRVRDAITGVTGNVPAAAVAGVAATAVVGGAAFVTLQHFTGPAHPGSPSAVRTAPPATGGTGVPHAGPSSSPSHRTTASGAHGHRGLLPPVASLPGAGALPAAVTSTAVPGQHAPASTPAPDPGPTHAPTPSGPSSPPSTPPGGDRVDLAVSASATAAGPAYQVTVRVSGLPAGHRATLVVTSDTTTLALTLDGRCGPLQLGRASCAVAGDPAPYSFWAVPASVDPATLTFTVRPDGAQETDPSDNSTRVVLAR